MGMAVCSGAVLVCDFGLAPSSLVVLGRKTWSGPGLAANIMDHVPMANVPPFGMCTSLGNPEVATATAMVGVLTPMPCSPATAAPWVPMQPKVLVAGNPVLDSNSSLVCSYGGLIRITYPGQVKEVL